MNFKLFFYAVFLFLPTVSYAETIGGINYSFNETDKTAKVISHEMYDYSGDIVIPEEVVYETERYRVTTIGKGAFLMDGITSISIPNSVTSIEEEAFNGCYGLTSLVIPSSVNSIGEYAFSSCSGLTSIVVESENTVYDSREGCNAIIETATNTLLYGCINTTIPFGVTRIGDSAFGSSGLTAITIPSGVTSIGKRAFCDCRYLSSVTLPERLISIDEGAFADCHSLSSIVFPNSLTTINKGAFGYTNLNSIRIPNRDTFVEENAFDACNNITDYYCYTKDQIDGLGYYHYMSFYEEYRLVLFDYVKNVTLHVPDITIESVLIYKDKFKDIVVDEIVTEFNLTYYVDGEIYKQYKHKYLDDTTIEADPTKKGMTFSGWSEIPEKMPGKDVDVYGTFSFSKITKDGIIYQVYDAEKELADVCGNDDASGEINILSSVEIDGYKYTVTDIVDFSFKDNTDITSVVIPENVMKIGDEAFAGCKNLAKIEIGKSVNQIEPRAFAGIDKLTDLTVYAENVPDADRTAFENSYTEDYVTLHVPAKALDKYKEAAPWKNFKEIVAIEGTEAEPTKYTLTYQVDGETYEKYELEEGEEITPLKEPTKEGYTFSGWSTIPATMPAEDVIIKGTFTQNESKGEESKQESENVDVDEITIKDIGKTTWCSEYDLDFTNMVGIKAYTATGYDNKSKTIWLTRVMTVPAGTGILVKGDPGTYKIPHSTEDAYYTNMFKGNTGDPIKIEETEGDMTNYYLSGKDGSFVSVNGSANIGKNKAYLQLPTKFFAGTRSIGVTYDDEGTTGIWNIEQGTVDSERDVWFNLQGQRVDKPRKGLYIKNGKKVVVR